MGENEIRRVSNRFNGLNNLGLNMSHSFTKIWIHAIFSTKDRDSLIKKSFSRKLFEHIQQHLEKDYECYIRIINGTDDHIHLLFLLNPCMAISDILKNIKGESSHWLNQENLSKFKFAWQIGYGAFSVSESKVKEVETYIRNQEEHHKKMNFQEEYDLFMKKHGLKIIENLNR